jgi:hypothetical protein
MANEISLLVKELEDKGLRGVKDLNSHNSQDNMSKKSKILPIDNKEEIKEKIQEKQQEVDKEKVEKKLESMDNAPEEFPEFEIGFDPFQEQR